MHGINMKVKCGTAEVLKALKANRTKHSIVVAEARKGYVEKAKQILAQKLEALGAGKIVSLHVDLNPPQDYTSTYDTTIKMLEMHTGEVIELEAQEFRQLIEDEWDWSQMFWMSNAGYTESAGIEANRRGYGR